MKNNRVENRINSLLGTPTVEKQAGLAYSLNAVLPSLLLIICILFFSVFGLIQEGYETQDWFLYFSYLLPQVSILLLTALLFKWDNRSVKQALSAQKCKPKYFIWGILLQIGLLALSQLNTVFLSFLEKFGYEVADITLPNMEGLGFIGVLIVVAIMPAICEEILFRGFLLNGLKCFSKVGTVLLCGALFSLFHQNPAQTAYQFCCGAAFALIALRANSILPTVLSHFLNNATILITLKVFGETFTLPSPLDVVFLVVCVFCLVVSLIYLIFIDKGEPQTEKTTNEFVIKTKKQSFVVFASVGILICIVSWLAVFFKGL